MNPCHGKHDGKFCSGSNAAGKQEIKKAADNRPAAPGNNGFKPERPYRRNLGVAEMPKIKDQPKHYRGIAGGGM